MLNVVALYRGRTLQDCRAVTVTSDPEVVKQLVVTLLSRAAIPDDEPLRAVKSGEREALEAILEELGG